MSSFTIDVVGSGFVGQATGKGFLAKGHRVRFVDVDPDKLQTLREGGFFAFTPQQLEAEPEPPHLTMLTVSTPTREGKINLAAIHAAARDLGQRLKNWDAYQVIVVRSTVVPGTTEELVSIIEDISGKRAGKDFGVCMNPEFLRERVAESDFASPWIVVIGELDKKSGDALAEIYADFSCPIHRVSIREAEFQKYVHNIFNAVKITFFNEMREVARATGVQPEAIFPLVAKSAEGIWNAEYGIRDFGPFDGHCLPKDTQAFLAWAENQDLRMPLLSAAIALNNELTLRQVQTKAAPAPALVKEVANTAAAVAS